MVDIGGKKHIKIVLEKLATSLEQIVVTIYNPLYKLRI